MEEYRSVYRPSMQLSRTPGGLNHAQQLRSSPSFGMKKQVRWAKTHKLIRSIDFFGCLEGAAPWLALRSRKAIPLYQGHPETQESMTQASMEIGLEVRLEI